MIGNIEFKKRRDFGQVINDTFTFMRQNFKPLIKTYFTFCGLFVSGQYVNHVIAAIQNG
jgi:hypothetical protein